MDVVDSNASTVLYLTRLAYPSFPRIKTPLLDEPPEPEAFFSPLARSICNPTSISFIVLNPSSIMSPVSVTNGTANSVNGYAAKLDFTASVLKKREASRP